MTRYIQLVNCDEQAAVSDEDYEYLSQWRWYKNAQGYAASTQNVPRLMHIVIVSRIGTIPEGFQVDHEDHSRLNDTRENLRVCTKAQNMANIPRSRYRGSSKYKGVAKRKTGDPGKPWRAQISINNTFKHLGIFATEEEAGRAYDAAARERFGEYAVLNFPEEAQGG